MTVIDLIIAILRGSKNLKDAKACLMEGDISKINFRTPGFEGGRQEASFYGETGICDSGNASLQADYGPGDLGTPEGVQRDTREIKEYQKILRQLVRRWTR
ncbi:MAG: hypothetical protein ACLTR6_16230 [Clostridium fessum]